jgi:transcriptional regulator with XRE-family HTH domain
MEVDLRIGSRLRQLRRERGVTIPELAEASGLTSGFISQLERDLSSASLSSLARICTALGVRFGDVMDRVPGVGHDVVTVAGQEHLLLTPADEHRFHVTESHLAPGASSGDELHTLPADAELVYVVEGRLELRVRQRAELLGAGESFAYSPRQPHGWRNPSDSEEAIVLCLAVPNPYS